jgi:hypothetical protein
VSHQELKHREQPQLTNYGDLLGAESLLIAVLGVLLGVWYPEISVAIHIEVPKSPKDVRNIDKVSVQTALATKALPIALMSSITCLIFLPNSIGISIDAVRDVAKRGWSALRDYDAVMTALVVVTIFAAILALYCFSLVRQLLRTKHTQKVGKS